MSVSGITETMQYFTFKLDDENFALEILKVREVLEFKKATKVPQTPSYMKGVINLRGSVVPVFDMGKKLGMPEVRISVDTCVVIVELMIDDEMSVLGVMVDAVHEVLELEPEQIDPPPSIGSKLNTDFIIGMGKHHDNFIMILDLTKVFSSEDLVIGKTVTEVKNEDIESSE